MFEVRFEMVSLTYNPNNYLERGAIEPIDRVTTYIHTYILIDTVCLEVKMSYYPTTAGLLYL